MWELSGYTSAKSLEVLFVSLVAVMVLIDMLAIWLYITAIREELYDSDIIEIVDFNLTNRSTTNQTFQRDSPPPSSPAISQRQVRRVESCQLNIGGVESEYQVFQDSDGNIIAVGKVTAAHLSANSEGDISLQGIEHTHIILIEREAYERYPENPEYRILTSTELTSISFGSDDEAIRRAILS